jgi:hypothetical protein
MAEINDDVTAEQERRFQVWRGLHQKAVQTMELSDAHASGRAFGKFYDLFVGPDRPLPSEGLKLLRSPQPGGDA